jgi:hypothetical protein
MATRRKPPSKLEKRAGGFHTVNSATRIVQEKCRELQVPWIEALGPPGEPLRRWRDSILTDLGGRENVSAQQLAIVELTARTHLLLESTDRFLCSMPSLVKLTTRQLFPIVAQRMQLSDALVRYLSTLGLRRVPKPVPTLQEIIAEHDTAKTNEAPP